AAGDEFLIVELADTVALRIRSVVAKFRIIEVDDERLHGGDLQRFPDDARELAVDDEQLRIRVVELEGDDRGIKARVEGVQDRLYHRYAKVRLEHRRRVRQHDADRIALADAALGERRSKLQ